ncbi:hypothetical protein [Streptomyces tricolor]
MAQEVWLTGLAAAGVGPVFVIGGVLLARSGSRRTPAGTAGRVGQQG